MRVLDAHRVHLPKLKSLRHPQQPAPSTSGKPQREQNAKAQNAPRVELSRQERVERLKNNLSKLERNNTSGRFDKRISNLKNKIERLQNPPKKKVDPRKQQLSQLNKRLKYLKSNNKDGSHNGQIAVVKKRIGSIRKQLTKERIGEIEERIGQMQAKNADGRYDDKIAKLEKNVAKLQKNLQKKPVDPRRKQLAGLKKELRQLRKNNKNGSNSQQIANVKDEIKSIQNDLRGEQITKLENRIGQLRQKNTDGKLDSKIAKLEKSLKKLVDRQAKATGQTSTASADKLNLTLKDAQDAAKKLVDQLKKANELAKQDPSQTTPKTDVVKPAEDSIGLSDKLAALNDKLDALQKRYDNLKLVVGEMESLTNKFGDVLKGVFSSQSRFHNAIFTRNLQYALKFATKTSMMLNAFDNQNQNDHTRLLRSLLAAAGQVGGQSFSSGIGVAFGNSNFSFGVPRAGSNINSLA